MVWVAERRLGGCLQPQYSWSLVEMRAFKHLLGNSFEVSLYKGSYRYFSSNAECIASDFRTSMFSCKLYFPLNIQNVTVPGEAVLRVSIPGLAQYMFSEEGQQQTLQIMVQNVKQQTVLYLSGAFLQETACSIQLIGSKWKSQSLFKMFLFKQMWHKSSLIYLICALSNKPNNHDTWEKEITCQLGSANS